MFEAKQTSLAGTRIMTSRSDAKESPTARFIAFTCVFFLAHISAFAQHPSPPQSAGGQRGIPSSQMPMDTSVTLLVSVRENTGMPLQVGAFVMLSSIAGSLHVTAATQDAGTAVFPDVKAGEYDVEVSAPEYKTTTEHISVFGAGNSYTVYVYVEPDSQTTPSNVPRGGPVMSPRLQSEIDKALEKMRRQQYPNAREHLEKAAKLAPGNPDVQYLLGMLECAQQHQDAARAKFEAALSINPSHERSLLALAELQLRSGHADQAVRMLEQAYQLNGADWRMHLLLAQAYASQKDYDKASMHAARAAELAKERGAAARLLFAQVLDVQGKHQEARRAYESVLQSFPKDPAAAEAKVELAKIDEAALLMAKTPVSNSPEPVLVDISTALPLTPTARPWAPADIDGKEYPVAPDVVCRQDDIMHKAELRTKNQLGNFEKFTATEHIEHQEINSQGDQGPIKSHDFQYLVFIERLKDGSFFLEESRDGGENLDAFPTSLASKGLVSLGTALFDPTYERDLVYNCEGLGKIRGHAAWQIRFEQRPGTVSRLRTWKNRRGLYSIPLKGRVWVAANTYDVLHIETDLVAPQKEIELTRDHLIIDYGPVKFEQGKISLWLPWYAEMFMELHHKRYHHRHTLTNYELFSVNTTSAISLPDPTPADIAEPHAEPNGPKP
jgi:tetratricopeptide (TPR) repeat protein